MLSRRFAAVVTIIIVAAFVVVAVAPAFAAAPASVPLHARLAGSTPKDGTTVATADTVVLTFNEDVDATFVKVTVKGPAGSEATGAPEVDGREVTQHLADGIPSGKHLVTYRVVSVDGHPVSGTVTFTTTSAAPASAPPSTSATASASAVASAGASRVPTAPDPAAQPAAQGSSGTSFLLLGVVALVALVALYAAAAAWRSRQAHRARTQPASDSPGGGRSGSDAGPDPFA